PEIDPEYFAKKIEIRSAIPGQVYYFQFSMSVKERMFFASNSGISNSSLIYTGEFSDFDGVPHFFIRELTEVNTRINKMVYAKPENSLYLATQNGVQSYSLTTGNFIRGKYFEDENILNIIYASDNKIYCSALDPELHYIDLHTGLTGAYRSNPGEWGSLLNNNILALHEDFSGNLWVGHQGQGISILDLHKKEFRTYRHNPRDKKSLISNTIMSINESADDIIIGTRIGGINILKKKDADLENPDFIPAPLKQGNQSVAFKSGIWDIGKVTDDYYLLGTLEGVYNLKKKGWKWEMTLFSDDPLFRTSTRKIYVDKNHNAWMGVIGYGLVFMPNVLNNNSHYYLFSSDPSDPESISDNKVISMLVDSKDRFWVGTLNGLNLVK
ncbi:MAG: ligand-binding sensor domain-containing protein, partial [Bacteroidales bacterium]